VGGYIIKRLMVGVVVLFAIMSISFFIMRLAPGGPFDEDKALPEEVKANVEAKFGLNKPLYMQYLLAMKGYAQLDFGRSFKEPDRTVMTNLKEHFPISLELGLYAFMVALLIGIGAGMIAGSKPGTARDHLTMSGAMIGISVPNIVLGPILLLFFATYLGWLPYGKWDSWQHKILPSVTLGLVYAAYFSRLMRGGMLEVIRTDYMRTARAKGLPPGLVMRRHAIRGAILPTVTYMGPAFASILTGSVVVERIFSVPGVSDFFVKGALNRDYPMVMGVVVLYSGLLVFLNICVDIAYTYLDPRVRLR